jgi:tetratricopeptide (TPR) repeat protein
MYKPIATLVFIFIVTAAAAQNRRLVDSLNQVIKEVKTDTGRIRPLIALAEYYIDQSGAGNRLDSADLFMKQAARLNKRYKVAEFQNHMDILSVDEHFQQHPGSDAKAAFLPLIANCSKTGDKKNESVAWIYLAFYTPGDEASNPFRLTCFEHIVSLSQQINDGKTEMEYRKSIADIHFQQRKYALAENELLQITKEDKKAGPVNIMRTYDLLASVYINKGEYNNALSYALKTISTMQIIGDSSSVMTFYERLIDIYNTLGKFSLSEEFARKALAHAIKYNEHDAVFYRSHSIVNALIRQGKANEALQFIISLTAKHKPTELSDKRFVQKCFGDCYYALKKYDLAERSYLEMIRYGTRKTAIGGTAYATDDYFTLINFYINRRAYSKAQQYLNYVLVAYAHGGTVEDLKNVYLSLFMVDSARGDFPAAIKDLRQHVKLKDSIFNVAKNKQIEELQVTYQIKEREKDLKLEKNRANLAQVNLQHTQNTRNWIMAGSGLLLIIAGLLYRQNRQKQKGNAIITHKNELLQKLVEEKEWLLKEVHHRVK